MTMLTPEDAALKWLCPLARTFYRTPPQANCIGPACALWRWETITTSHPLWAKSVKAAAAETGEKPPYREASKFVAENLEVLGMVPTRGFCGAGGQP